MSKYAAVDIGSNSVRMQVAEVIPGSPARVLAAERDVTRLGESVFRTGRISPEALEFTCSQLRKMAAIYRQLDVAGIRAVATSAVRDASNQKEFLERASEAAGAAVEVISGQEEARLIQLGVESRWPHKNRRTLVIDVGGGSAELIVSENGRMVEAFSKPLGAVRLTSVFLTHDPPTAKELHQLEEYIQEKIGAAVARIGRRRMDRVIATSASAAAVVGSINRVARSKREAADKLRATTPQVRKFYREISGLDLAARKKVRGIGPRRAEIIVPGAAVFLKILEALRLPSIYYSSAGLRDGIIAELAARGVGRERAQLTPEQRRSVEEMARRYGVPVKHARKVAALGRSLFDSLAPVHRLPLETGRLLEAAAYLHDVGHFVSDVGHHKHSHYLVSNSDMPGFTAWERKMTALLCRYHRKSLPAPRHDIFQALTPEERQTVMRLTPMLRLADGLDRSHDQRVEGIACQMRNGGVTVKVESAVDTDLEMWAAERVAELFEQVFALQLTITRARKQT